MVRWLAGRGANVETQASITASTDKAYYEPGEPIHISAIVRDKEGQGANNAKVVASVRGPAGRPEQVTLTTVAGPGGHYGGAIEPPSAGGYEVVVEARLGELSLKSDKIPLEVGRPNLEFEKLDLDEKMLERIAADTGGRYVPLSTADHLMDQLDRTPAQTDRAHRAAALLAARFLGAVRGGADDGMDTEKKIPTKIEKETMNDE